MALAVAREDADAQLGAGLERVAEVERDAVDERRLAFDRCGECPLELVEVLLDRLAVDEFHLGGVAFDVGQVDRGTVQRNG